MPSSIAATTVSTNNPFSAQITPKTSCLSNPAARLAKNLLAAGGVTALVVSAVINPTLNAAITTAANKVAEGFVNAKGYVATHLTGFAAGTVAIGALNLLDGAWSMRSARQKTIRLVSDYQTRDVNARNPDAFNRLKRLYGQMKRRGALQAAVGVVAITIGTLALAGIVSNPYGLAAVLAVATAVYVGVQVHKYWLNRQIKAAQVAYLNPPSSESAAS